MIELKGVSKFYTANGVTNIGLQNINLKLNKGEIVAITGESGSGKSTLLNVITKMDTFDDGEIYYKGNETSYFSISDMDDFRKNKIGFIFQNYNILDSYSVLENVMLPLILKGVNPDTAKKQALDLIEKVGLKGKEKNRGTKLSGGEKQRCVIARALASDCEILACDEPTGNLDSKTAKEIIELIKEVAKDKLVLIVTHNYPEVDGVATRQLIVADGKIVEDIIYEAKPEDTKVSEDLDYKPLPKKVAYSISLRNLKNTPKKTALVCIVFFVIAFVFLALTQVIDVLLDISGNDYTYNNRFENYGMVYNLSGDTIDIDVLDKSGVKYRVNNFAEQYTVMTSLDSYDYNSLYISEVEGFKLVEGKMPSNDKEVILSFNSSSKGEIDTGKKSVGKKVNISDYSQTIYESEFVVCGIGTYESNAMWQSVYTFNDKFGTMMDMFAACKNSFSLNFKTEDDIYINYALKFHDGSGKPTLHLPASLENKVIFDFKVAIYEYNTFDVVYDAADGFGTFDFYTDSGLMMDPYFAGVYATPKKLKSLERKLKSNNMLLDIPTEITNTDGIDYLIEKILKFVLTLEFSSYLIGVFFITYIIISKIYASRSKDYEILRTLGVTKKDMTRIVNSEMLFIGIGVSIFNFIFSMILYNIVPIMRELKNITLFNVFFYFFVIIFFSYLMGKRFNRRLYKFSVRKSMKGVEEDD